MKTLPRVGFLVHTLERRDGLALVLVESVPNNLTVCQVDLAVRLLLEGEGVLHPVNIVTVGEVLAGVSTTRLLSVSSSGGSLGTVEWSEYFIITSVRDKLTRK